MKSSNMKAALLKRGREPAAVGNVAVLPVAEMPMVLMLEQLRRTRITHAQPAILNTKRSSHLSMPVVWIRFRK